MNSENKAEEWINIYNVERETEEWIRKYNNDMFNSWKQSIIHGKTDIFKHLHYHDYTSYDDNCGIQLASEYGNDEILLHLLQSDNPLDYADPSHNNNYALRWASRNGHIECVKILLDYSIKYNKIDPTCFNNYALFYANENNHISIVELLLKDNRVRSSILDLLINESTNIDPSITMHFAENINGYENSIDRLFSDSILRSYIIKLLNKY